MKRNIFFIFIFIFLWIRSTGFLWFSVLFDNENWSNFSYRKKKLKENYNVIITSETLFGNVSFLSFIFLFSLFRSVKMNKEMKKDHHDDDDDEKRIFYINNKNLANSFRQLFFFSLIGNEIYLFYRLPCVFQLKFLQSNSVYFFFCFFSIYDCNLLY